MSRVASAPWPLKALYFGLLTAAAAATLTSVAALVALAGLRRLSVHLDVFAVLGWFWYFRADPLVCRWAGAGVLTSLALGGGVALAIATARQPPLYGAARWAGEGELAHAGLRAKQGIVLGWRGGRLLTFGGPEHVLLYAPTRTGKGVGVVIPNLLTWPGSVVVLDIKRENWAASAGFRARHGQTVILFDPFDPEGRTARFNPLGHIDREDPVAVMDELQKLAVMLFAPPPNADPFWAEAARTAFIGVGAYVAATPELSFSFGAIYGALTRSDARTHLAAIAAARSASARPLSAGCLRALGDFCSASENTFASIKQTVTARMGLWLNPRICAATETSDFDLRELREKRISLYLAVSPDNLERIAPLYSLILQLLVDVSTRALPPADWKGPQVLLLLDEFARLGHASMLAHGFSYLAGYGLRLLAVLQSPAQLRREYGADLAEEIITNCGVEVAFTPKDQKVANDLSERLGAWTFAGRSRSRPSLLSSGRRSLTESDQRRALQLPQELIQMPSHQLLLLRAGVPPIRATKIVYWRERAFRRRVCPPPVVAKVLPSASALGPEVAAAADGPREAAPGPCPVQADLTLDLIIPGLAAEGLEPVPEAGATEAEVQAWVDRFIDASARGREADHA